MRARLLAHSNRQIHFTPAFQSVGYANRIPHTPKAVRNDMRGDCGGELDGVPTRRGLCELGHRVATAPLPDAGLLQLPPALCPCTANLPRLRHFRQHFLDCQREVIPMSKSFYRSFTWCYNPTSTALELIFASTLPISLFLFQITLYNKCYDLLQGLQNMLTSVAARRYTSKSPMHLN